MSTREKRERDFAKFDLANPHVYRLFVKYAQDARAAGKGRYSARTIGERLRWQLEVEMKSTDGFRINNNHFPFYARKLVSENPEFDGLFQFRDKAG